MIIQCENCPAKFRLDDAKIPDQGRKVRCSKCQHVFFVRKELAPPPPIEEEEEIRLRYEEEPEIPPSPPAPQEPPPPVPESEEAFEPTVRIDLTTHEELEFREEPEAQPPPAPRKRGLVKPLVAVAAVVVLLGVTGAVLNHLGWLPFLSSETPEAPVANLTVDQAKLDGKWEKNAQVPRIFIINGVVQNQSKKPRAFVKVRGLLLDKAGKPMKDVWVFCGNSIPAQDLRTKAPSEIQTLMRNREGQRGMNKQIAPGASVPFTVVFFDVPEGVESFGVEVIEAQIPGAS